MWCFRRRSSPFSRGDAQRARSSGHGWPRGGLDGCRSQVRITQTRLIVTRMSATALMGRTDRWRAPAPQRRSGADPSGAPGTGFDGRRALRTSDDRGRHCLRTAADRGPDSDRCPATRRPRDGRRHSSRARLGRRALSGSPTPAPRRAAASPATGCGV